MAYCYRSRFLKYDSMWSMINKLGFWNVCHFGELIEHFGSHKGRTAYTIKNILTKEMFNTLKISKTIGVKEELLQINTVEQYLDANDALLFLDFNLRICPLCIESGYHSLFHQLLPLSTCLIHNVPLTNKCPHCERIINDCIYRPVPSYYSCCTCGYLFTDLEPRPDNNMYKLVKKYDRVAKVLLSRKQVKESSALYLNFIREKTNRYFQEQVWNLWSVMYGGAKAQKDIQFAKLLYEASGNEKEMLPPSEIYMVMKNHEWCVNRVGEAGYWFRIGTKLTDVRICPFAVGYLIYYMYCNSRLSAHGVRLTDIGKIKTRRVAEIFDLEYLNIFYACLSIAYSMYTANEIRIPSHEEIATYLFYWEVSQSKTERNIYYFQPRGPIDRMDISGMKCSAKHKEDLELNIKEINKIYLKMFNLKPLLS